ncbi:MAG: hypothetical protein JKY01_07395 [Pseudomonadales bacterium]|nr:hypothetical protein [Pseudomonadales bacterium]
MKKLLLPLAVTAAVAFSSGCSDSKHNSAPASADVTKSTLTGTAAKGIIQLGIVTAVELDASGSDVAAVGTTKTDSKGHYSLKLGDNYTGGVVRLRISADADTRMTCDAFDGCGGTSAFGDDVSLPTGFSLDAVIKPTGDSVNVQITPLTHMAAARAVSSGSVNADTIASAISEVNQIVGVNIMETEIVDITDVSSLSGASDEAKQLALFNSGLAEILVAGDMQQNLDDLAASFEDGQFSSTDAVTITEITTAVSDAAVDAASSPVSAELEDAIDDVATVVAVIESATNESGDYNPEPSSNAGATEVAQAKAMLTNTRTFVEQIGTSFDQPLDALDIDSQTAEAVLSEDTAALSQLLTNVIGQVFEALDTDVPDLAAELANPNASGYPVVIRDDSAQELGTITAKMASSSAGVSVSLNGSLTGSVEGTSRTVTLTDFKIASNLLASQLTFDSIDPNLLMSLSAVDDAELNISGTASAIGIDGKPDTAITFNSVAFGVGFSTAQAITTDTSTTTQGDDLEAAINAVSFIGDMSIMANGATFNGDAELKLVDFSSVLGESPLSLQKIALNGSFNSTTKGSFSAGVSLTIDNATSFDTFSFLDYEENVETYVTFNQPTSSFSQADKNIINAAMINIVDASGGAAVVSALMSINSQGEHWLNVWLNNGDSNSVLLSGLSGGINTLIASAVNTELGTTPESIKVWYASYDILTGSAEAWVEASFPAYESANNFVKGTLTFSTTANVPDLPEATVVTTVSRTALNGGNVSMTVSQDGQSFKLELANADAQAAISAAVMTLTTPDGAKLVLNMREEESGGTYVVSGTALVNGVQVGDISETSNGVTLVRYNDGSFESLF